MPPMKVCFKALERRLSTTFSHISRSTCTGSGKGGQFTANVSPAFSTAERKTLVNSAVCAARSTGS